MPRAIPLTRSETIHLSTISTPREHLLTIGEGPIDQSILSNAEDRHFRAVAVVRGNGDLAGLVPTRKLRDLFERGEEIRLDQAEIRVPDLPGKVELLELLDGLGTYGAVIHRAEPQEGRDANWFGLITNADLNRPVFRAHIYMVIATMETSLGELLMDEFADDWGAIRLLNDHTQSRVADYFEEAKKEGVELSPIVYITLSDMFTIVAKSRTVWQQLGFSTPDDVEPLARVVNEMRNRTMHPIQPLIHRGADVRELQDAVETMLSLTAKMQSLAHPRRQ